MVIGSIIPYTLDSVPEGFLRCDGSAVSRVEYSDLFAVIGTTYGSGDGSTTFNIPNLSGKVSMGSSSGHVLGSSAGVETVTLTTNDIPSHLHNIPQHTHSHNIVLKTPSLSHTVSQQATFTYVQLNATAKRAVGGTGANHFTSITSAAMSRSTNLGVADHAATACTMSGSITDCGALTSESTGDDGAHNNMMPYLTLTYLIQAMPDTPPGPVIPSMVLFNGALPVGPSGAYIAGRK